MYKIVFLIPSLTLGGMERVIGILLNEFSERNLELHLILYGRNRVIEYSIPESIIVHRPTFLYSNTNRFNFTVKTIFYLRKEINKVKPNTILSFGEYWNNMVLLSLYGLKFSVYISDRSQPNKNLGKFHNILRNFLYPTATGYIAQTSKASEIAIKNKWNSNVIVIGNPITKVKQQEFGEKQNIILTVGRLIPTKHIDELIEIFKIVNAKDWKLIVVGGDSKNMSLLAEYKNLVKNLGLQNSIYLEGSKPDVMEYYKKAKIFAFTSSSEGFPNVIGEAMSYGLPVIAYDCIAGPADLILDGETGFLIKKRNQKLYVNKLKKLIYDSKLRNRQGEKGKVKVKDFEASLIAEKYYNFITKK